MHVIPRPHRIDTTGAPLPAFGTWRVEAATPELEQLAATARELLDAHVTDPAGTSAPSGVITLTLADLDPGDEAYELQIGPTGIDCRAGSEVGLWRAAASAIQLASLGDLRPGTIIDRAALAWRGMLIDPARRFVAAHDLRRVIDLMALYKMNTLHLHLTDNQGWRLEIPGFPQLTAGGPHYTAEEYAELQRYAAARFVTIVPEIDLPGHCAALTAAIPTLATAHIPERTAQILARLGGGVSMSPLDLGDPHTMDTVGAILGAVCSMTTGPYVHIGGDEAFGMLDADFAEAIRRLRAAVRAAGKEPTGWQESARAGLNPGELAQFWVDVSMNTTAPIEEFANSEAGKAFGFDEEVVAVLRETMAPTATDLSRIVGAGGRVVLSPQSHLYLDRPYDPATVPPEMAEQAARLGLPLYPAQHVREPAEWDPGRHGVPADQLAGVEATLFAETIQSFDDLCVLLLPRFASVAEVAWRGAPCEWEEHRARLAHHGRLWSERGLPYLRSTAIDWQP